MLKLFYYNHLKQLAIRLKTKWVIVVLCFYFGFGFGFPFNKHLNELSFETLFIQLVFLHFSIKGFTR